MTLAHLISTSVRMHRPATILGLESSCDDTAAAVIRAQIPDGQQDPAHIEILSNEVWTQTDDHRAFGGVVPEIAARSHVTRMDKIVEKAISVSGLNFTDLDGVAVTAGPGLVGGVMVGLTTAKAIAMSHDLALIPVNHLEGHALSVRMTEIAPFPYLLLLVSGGHTQLIQVDGLGQYKRLGTTIDDAAGEAFDKSAKLLGLAQPGGPHIEKIAQNGDSTRFSLPKPLKNRKDCDFSFSGLKTAMRLTAEALSEPGEQDIADLCACFQASVADHLASRTSHAMTQFADRHEGQTGRHRLVVAGGVAANGAIRNYLKELCQTQGWELIVPPAKYCTDNGAMIAWCGLEHYLSGAIMERDDALGLAPRARWPLATPPQGSHFGGGRKGPKA